MTPGRRPAPRSRGAQSSPTSTRGAASQSPLRAGRPCATSGSAPAAAHNRRRSSRSRSSSVMISGPPGSSLVRTARSDGVVSATFCPPVATRLAPPRTRGLSPCSDRGNLVDLEPKLWTTRGCEYPCHLFQRRRATSGGSGRAIPRAARQLRCVMGRVQQGRGRRSGEEWSGSASGGGKCVRTCDDPRRGGERGSSPRPTRGGRSRTGLARSRTIRDFHGVPESLLRQTHAPDLTPNGGRLCSPRGKPLRASLDSPYCRVLRLGQDCHCKVEHADLQQVVLPRRPDQSAGRTAHCVRPVRVPGGRRRPRSDGADAGVSLLPVPRLGRGTRCGRSSPRRCTI